MFRKGFRGFPRPMQLSSESETDLEQKEFLEDEALPRGAWQRAEHAISGSDLVLVIGTSGIVYPAAELPERALAAGTPVIEFNIDESALSPYVTRSVRTSAAVGLPALLDALGE